MARARNDKELKEVDLKIDKLQEKRRYGKGGVYRVVVVDTPPARLELFPVVHVLFLHVTSQHSSTCNVTSTYGVGRLFVRQSLFRAAGGNDRGGLHFWNRRRRLYDCLGWGLGQRGRLYDWGRGQQWRLSGRRHQRRGLRDIGWRHAHTRATPTLASKIESRDIIHVILLHRCLILSALFACSGGLFLWCRRGRGEDGRRRRCGPNICIKHWDSAKVWQRGGVSRLRVLVLCVCPASRFGKRRR